MKPFDLGGKEKEWAHLICVNWTPEIWFTNDSNVEAGGQLDKNRFKLACGKCKLIKGSCIQCDFKNCQKGWHVRCATKLGVIKQFEEMRSELGNPQNQWSTPVFCQAHADEGKSMFKNKGEQGINSKRGYLKKVKEPKVQKVPKIQKVLKNKKKISKVKATKISKIKSKNLINKKVKSKIVIAPKI